MDRLTVLCFAGTYGLALIGELARFAVRSAARWYLTVGLTALAWIVQTAYLVNLAQTDGEAAGDDAVRVAGRALLDLRGGRALPDGPGAQAGGGRDIRLAAGARPDVDGRKSVNTESRRTGEDFGAERRRSGARCMGSFCLPAAVSTCVAFAAGMMYLVQANRLKHKRALAVRVCASEPGAVGAIEPRGDHAGVPLADVRPIDWHGAQPRAAEVKGCRAGLIPRW